MDSPNDGDGNNPSAHFPAVMRVGIGSGADIVVARQQGQALVHAMQFSATDAAFIATTVSELARALLARTLEGEIWLHSVQEDTRSGVVIEAHVPLDLKWHGGEESLPASELALPDVCRLVDEFDIAQGIGRRTTIRAAKWRR